MYLVPLLSLGEWPQIASTTSVSRLWLRWSLHLGEYQLNQIPLTMEDMIVYNAVFIHYRVTMSC